MRTMQFALVVVTGLSLCACSKDETGKTFTIGALMGLSGNNADAAYGEAVTLGVDQLNKALEKEGEDFRFKLDLQDSQAIPAVAMQLGLKSVASGARILVFDTSQDVTVAAQSFYDDDPTNDLNVVVIGALSSGSDIIKPDGATWQQDPDHWIWRTVMSSNPCASTAIDVLGKPDIPPAIPGDLNGDGIVKIAMFGTDDALGRPLLQEAARRAKAIFGDGVKIEARFHPNSDSVDNTQLWANYVSALLDNTDDALAGNAQPITIENVITTTSAPGAGSRPDMFFAGLQVLYNVPTYIAYRDYVDPKIATDPSFNIPFMGSVAMRGPRFLTAVGSRAENAQSVGFLTAAPNDSGAQFTADFNAIYGASGGNGTVYDAPVVSGLAALIAAHATGNIDTVGNDDIKAALAQTSASGGVRVTAGVEGLRTAIRAIKAGEPIDYDGASGPLDFDQYGDVRSYTGHNVVQSGSWAVTQIYDCTKSSDSCPELHY